MRKLLPLLVVLVALVPGFAAADHEDEVPLVVVNGLVKEANLVSSGSDFCRTVKVELAKQSYPADPEGESKLIESYAFKVRQHWNNAQVTINNAVRYGLDLAWLSGAWEDGVNDSLYRNFEVSSASPFYYSVNLRESADFKNETYICVSILAVRP